MAAHDLGHVFSTFPTLVLASQFVQKEACGTEDLAQGGRFIVQPEKDRDIILAEEGLKDTELAAPC